MPSGGPKHMFHVQFPRACFGKTTWVEISLVYIFWVVSAALWHSKPDPDKCFCWGCYARAGMSLKPGEEKIKEATPSSWCEGQWDLMDCVFRRTPGKTGWTTAFRTALFNRFVPFGVCQQVTANRVTQIQFLAWDFLHTKLYPSFMDAHVQGAPFLEGCALAGLSWSHTADDCGSGCSLPLSPAPIGTKWLEAMVVVIVFGGACVTMLGLHQGKMYLKWLCMYISPELAAPRDSFIEQGERWKTSPKCSSFRLLLSEWPLFAE